MIVKKHEYHNKVKIDVGTRNTDLHDIILKERKEIISMIVQKNEVQVKLNIREATRDVLQTYTTIFFHKA